MFWGVKQEIESKRVYKSGTYIGIKECVQVGHIFCRHGGGFLNKSEYLY